MPAYHPGLTSRRMKVALKALTTLLVVQGSLYLEGMGDAGMCL